MNFLRVISNLFRFNRTNWRVVALCFLAALVFWLFNSLNKEHSTSINFPLHFEFDQERYVAVSMPHQVRLNVSGNGWDLLRKSLGVKLPALNIPLERPAEVKKIVGSTLPAVLASQIGALQINYVVNDTLFIQVDSKDTHTFHLVADLTGVTFRNGYGRISPVVILPDSVQLEGPKSLLHKLPDSITLFIANSKVDENVREEVEVKVDHDELMKRNPPVVEVHFEVGEVEEVVLKLKVAVLNNAAGLKVDGLPDSITCRIQIPASLDRAMLPPAGAQATVDLRQASAGDFAGIPKATGLLPGMLVLGIDSVKLKLY